MFTYLNRLQEENYVIMVTILNYYLSSVGMVGRLHNVFTELKLNQIKLILNSQ